MTEPQPVILDADSRRRVLAALAHVLAQWPTSSSSQERRAFVELFDAFAAESQACDTANSGPLWESTTEAARRLGITPQAVTARCRNKTIPAQRVGRQWLIERTETTTWPR